MCKEPISKKEDHHIVIAYQYKMIMCLKVKKGKLRKKRSSFKDYQIALYYFVWHKYYIYFRNSYIYYQLVKT